MSMRLSTEVLVIGAGPAGSAAAYWAARAGHMVVVLEKETMPRERVCGDALTPKAVGHLHDMGLSATCDEFHHHHGLRMTAHGRSIELRWPTDHDHPSHGLVIRRSALDQMLLEHTTNTGAQVWTGVEVLDPIIEHGHLRGCRAFGSGNGTGPQGDIEVRARFVVIADGPLSPFGRALGTARTRTYAQGVAMRGYFPSIHHNDDVIESVFDLRDNTGEQLPGYGWVFPVGDGTVNAGVGLLSHHHGNDPRSMRELFDQWICQIPEYWGIASEDIENEPEGGRLPMGASVHPRSGPNWVVVGDAAGSVNPFNGDGIEPALSNGRLAATVISDAIRNGDGLELRQYEKQLASKYDHYYRLGRLATKALGRPGLMRRFTLLGIRSRVLTELVMRISTNLVNNDAGGTESVYEIGKVIARLIPDRD
jgi:geranylgeranyl reductase family protein